MPRKRPRVYDIAVAEALRKVWYIMDSPTRIAKENIIPHLSKLCNKLESE